MMVMIWVFFGWISFLIRFLCAVVNSKVFDDSDLLSLISQDILKEELSRSDQEDQKKGRRAKKGHSSFLLNIGRGIASVPISIGKVKDCFFGVFFLFNFNLCFKKKGVASAFRTSGKIPGVENPKEPKESKEGDDSKK